MLEWGGRGRFWGGGRVRHGTRVAGDFGRLFLFVFSSSRWKKVILELFHYRERDVLINRSSYFERQRGIYRIGQSIIHGE